MLYRATRASYPLAVRATGMQIFDDSGKAYLDMSGGAAVSCVGHSHPAVLAATRAQLDTLAFAHTAFFSNAAQEQLAAQLAARFGEPGARVYFLSGGSEANETALKLAWQYWAAAGQPDKQLIVSREHSYHGNTFGALSISGNPQRRKASAAPLLDWPRIPPCYEYREREDGESSEDYGLRAASYLTACIERWGAGKIAAFIAEPVVGSSLGVVPPAAGYLQRIRKICDDNDILLIADEIMCGAGRTGKYFAFEHFGIRPDIVTLAKGIGGGYLPLGAAIAGARVTTRLLESGFAHGHTYVGHATACAAGLAVHQVLDSEGLLERCQSLGQHLAAALQDRFATHPHVGDIRQLGLFAGIELVADRSSKHGFSDRNAMAEDLRLAAMHEGLICYPGSIRIGPRTIPHIMLAPPLIATANELDEGLQRLHRAIDRCLPAKRRNKPA